MPAPPVTSRRDLMVRLCRAMSATPDIGARRYRADGCLAAETLGAASPKVARAFAYDALGRPTSLDETAQTLAWSYRKDGAATGPYGDGNILAETVSYKAAGFAAGTTPPAGSSVSYAYDAFGRLTQASSTNRPALNQTAAYDGDGNLSTLATAGTTQTYAYTAGTNRLSSAGGQSYTHDAAGQVTSAAGTALVRDPVTGRVRKATKGATTIALLYGPSGRQVLATSGTTRRLQVRDGGGIPLAEYEAVGTGAASLALAHVHGTTGRIAVWTGNQTYAISTDIRGSTRLAYDAAGKAAAWLSYRAYGTADAAATSTGALTDKLRWRFTGQEWSEALGLYDYGARLYDPALGRFLAPDPSDETPSPYMYVGGNPVTLVDPDGEAGWGVIARKAGSSCIRKTMRGR